MTIDFGKNKTKWKVVSDQIMGGVSKGFVKIKNDSIVFEGEISFDNNGGFSSILSDYRHYDLSSFENVEIKAKAKGQSFALKLKPHKPHYLPSFKKELPLIDQMETHQLKLQDFDEYIKNNKTGNKLNTSILNEIKAMSFITHEPTEGDFFIEISYLKFF